MYYTRTLETNTLQSRERVSIKGLEGQENKSLPKWKEKPLKGLGKGNNLSPFCTGMAYKSHCHNTALPVLLTVLLCVWRYRLVCVHTCTHICACAYTYGASGWPWVSSSVISTPCSKTWSLTDLGAYKLQETSCPGNPISVPSCHGDYRRSPP